jgi:dTDP-4-amino-4,6-dideoxygalactose transaminase
VFSCSPTKVVTSGEGGIIATNDEEFAKKLRVGRNYGDDGSYDCDFAGINARMSEFNAVLGLASLEMSNDNIKRRLELFGMYESRLGKLPGINFPKTTPGGTVNGVYFTIIIDQDSFGLTRDQLYTALKSENVDTRRYYYPALHQQTVNSGLTAQYEGKLPVTDYMSANTLTLPMFSHMTDEEASGVCDAVERLQENAETVRGNWKEIEAKVTK